MSALAAGGGIIQAFGSIKGGQDQADTLNYQARVAGQNAQAALIAAKLNADKQMMQFNKVQGQDIANYAASGVDASSGSVLNALASNAEGAELDKQNILYGGQVRAINYQNQASVDQVAAGRAKTAGYINAVGSLALAGAHAYGINQGGIDDSEEE